MPILFLLLIPRTHARRVDESGGIVTTIYAKAYFIDELKQEV